MRMLVVALRATGQGPPDGVRMAELAIRLLPERYPTVVGHVTAMTAASRSVELAVVLREGVPDPRVQLRGCVDGLIAELAADGVPGAAGWSCHAPRLPEDAASDW